MGQASSVQSPPYLNRKFSGGRHDEADGALAIPQRRLVHDVPEEGQQVRQSLSRACFGDTNHITAAHDGGNGLRGRQTGEQLPNTRDAKLN